MLRKELAQAAHEGRELRERLAQVTDEGRELRERLTQVSEEKEMHAYSVRSLISQRERLLQIMEFAGKISRFENGNDVGQVLNQVRLTEAQFYQDIVGLLLTRGRKDGWFVEFGACDGMRISNTYILEKKFGWQGIVAEPGRSWHASLRVNRSCYIDTRCVFSESGLKIPFYEASEDSLESSNIAEHMGRKRFNTYEVETVSLLDLLIQYGAPAHIDFMSVDTEGTEYEILSTFPFDKFSFGLICVEHHSPQEEERMKKLMFEFGYTQIFRSISGFDGWYVQKDVSEVV